MLITHQHRSTLSLARKGAQLWVEFGKAFLTQEFKTWNSQVPGIFAPWQPAIQIMKDPGEKTSRKLDPNQS